MHNRLFQLKRFCVWWLMLAGSAGLLLANSASAPPVIAHERAEGNRLAISNIDETRCPSFQAILRYTDSRSVFINNILNTDLVISPGGQAGRPLPTQFARVDDPALAVAIVADLSMRVRQTGLLNRPRYRDMAESIADLAPRFSNSRSTFSLITFSDTIDVPVSQEADFRYITNELTNLDTKVAQEETAGTYPLSQAVQSALEELAAAPDTSNRVLFVYAAGDAMTDLRATLQPALSNMLANPPAMTFIGLTPALEAPARAIGADYYPFFAENLVDLNTLRTDIDKRYRDMTTLNGYYSVKFEADTLPPGQQTVTFSAPGASTSATIEMCSIAPQIAMQNPRETDQGKFLLTVTTLYTQTTLAEVTYYLDQEELGRAGSESQFAFEFDPVAEQYRDRDYEGERDYMLSARAVDQNGQESPLAEPQPFRIPKRSWPVVWILAAAFVGLLAVGAIFVGVQRWWPGGLKGEAQDDTQPPEGDTQPPETLPPAGPPLFHSYFQPLEVAVTDTQTGASYTYKLNDPQVAEYGIGTSITNHIRIVRAAPGVSRNHAKLTPIQHGWELTDRSKFGTFLDNTPSEPRKLDQQPIQVQPGTKLWLGREITITLNPLSVAPQPWPSNPDTQPPGPDTHPPKNITQSLNETRYLQHQRHFMPLRVVVTDTETHETYDYLLNSADVPAYTIGIGQQNIIQIKRQAAGVSRNHAKLTPVSGGWELSDTSNYGTYLGEVPASANRIGQQPVVVVPGTTIWIGNDIKLRLEEVAQ